MASVFAGQLSIGISNDAIDAPRDRIVGRADKPLSVSGAPLRTAWAVAVSAGALALVLSAVLGWQMALAHLVFVGAGWAYNAGLKSTVWSALCFAVGFAVLPSLAPLSLPRPEVAPAWAWGAGAALGLAVHFSNVLPDLGDDARTGVRGLPHRIGGRGSAVLAFIALFGGAVVVTAGSSAPDRPVDAIATGIGLAAVTALAVWGLLVSLRGSVGRVAFRLVMLAALLLAAQLVLTSAMAA